MAWRHHNFNGRGNARNGNGRISSVSKFLAATKQFQSIVDCNARAGTV
jgi:hypothetical protein